MINSHMMSFYLYQMASSDSLLMLTYKLHKFSIFCEFLFLALSLIAFLGHILDGLIYMVTTFLRHILFLKSSTQSLHISSRNFAHPLRPTLNAFWALKFSLFL